MRLSIPYDAHMNEDQVIARLRAKMGTKQQREFAQELGISESFLSEVLKRIKPPTGPLLQFLGLHKVVTYRRKQ